ncbi:MAG: hypothetical protein M1459_01805 [Patescibacteria group bacterium]|nr:hypothetical protein [Patescibacteria group bacterium]
MYDFIVPSSSNDHKKAIILVSALGAIVIAGSIFTWIRMSATTPETSVPTLSKEQRLASMLKSEPVKVSEEQINAVAALLAKTKEPTQAQKDSVANMLMQSQ